MLPSKPSAVLWAAILLGGALAVPPAAAPGELVEITADATRQAFTIRGVGTFPDISVPTTGHVLRHSTAYQLRITGLEPSGATRVELVNTSTGAPQVLMSADLAAGPTPSTRSATFILSASTVKGPGVYEVRAAGSSAAIARLLFHPLDDLGLVITSANPQPYVPGSVVSLRTTHAVGVALTDCDLRDGNTKRCIGFLPSPNATDASGALSFLSALPMGVGMWPVFAFVNHTSSAYHQAPNGDSIPERLSSATLVVQPQLISLARTGALPAVGFAEPVVFRPTIDGISPFKVIGGAYPAAVAAKRINVTLASPTGLHVAFNWSLPAAGASTLDLDRIWASDGSSRFCWNASVAGTFSCANQAAKIPDVDINREHGEIWINASDDIGGTDVWAPGLYTLSLELEAAGGAVGGGAEGSHTAPEYVGTASFSAAPPPAATLQVAPRVVDVPPPSNSPTAPGVFASSQGSASVTLTISGSAAFRHPLCDVAAPGLPCASSAERDTEFRDNITLRGAVLPGWNVTSYDPATGQARLRFTPTMAGLIHVDVDWKGRIWTQTITVSRGANLTLDVDHLTVGRNAPLVATLRDAFGNPVSTGKTYVLPRSAITPTTGDTLPSSAFRGAGSAVVFGNGAADAGQDGRYLFTLTPSHVADLVVAAEVGTPGNLRYAYAPLVVHPASELVATLATDRAMAALRTPIGIQIANASGTIVPSDTHVKVHLLDDAQRRRIAEMGPLAFFGGGAGPAAVSLVQTAAGAILNVSASAGQRHVYVCASPQPIADCRSATQDNRLSMPILQVSPYRVTFSPPSIANNPAIVGPSNVTITVHDAHGAPAGGTLRARANASLLVAGAQLAIPVLNGTASFVLTGANAGVGNVEWDFDPRDPDVDEAASERAAGALTIGAGDITWSPARIPVGHPAFVSVRLADFAGAPLPGRIVRLCSQAVDPNFPNSAPLRLSAAERDNCPASETTTADGTAGIVVRATALTPAIAVYVNDSHTGRTIPLTAGPLRLTADPPSPSPGDDVMLRVRLPSGQLSEGIRVVVTTGDTNLLDSTTNADGAVLLPTVGAGTYSIRAARAGFDDATLELTARAAKQTLGARLVLSDLTLPDELRRDEPITISVLVTNAGDAPGKAAATLLVDDVERATMDVALDPGASTTLAFTHRPTASERIALTLGDERIEREIALAAPPATAPKLAPGDIHVSVRAAANATLGRSERVEVFVANRGSLPLDAPLTLHEGERTVGEANAILAPGTSWLFGFTWTPDEEGPASLTARVEGAHNTYRVHVEPGAATPAPEESTAETPFPAALALAATLAIALLRRRS